MSLGFFFYKHKPSDKSVELIACGGIWQVAKLITQNQMPTAKINLSNVVIILFELWSTNWIELFFNFFGKIFRERQSLTNLFRVLEYKN